MFERKSVLVLLLIVFNCDYWTLSYSDNHEETTTVEENKNPILNGIHSPHFESASSSSIFTTTSLASSSLSLNSPSFISSSLSSSKLHRESSRSQGSSDIEDASLIANITRKIEPTLYDDINKEFLSPTTLQANLSHADLDATRDKELSIQLTPPTAFSSSSTSSVSTQVSLINSSNPIMLNKNEEEWEMEKRKTNSNPSVDDIISGILQLIGGNMKLSRPPPNMKLHPLNQNQFNRPEPINPTRINNRSPPKVSFLGPLGHIPNLIPPSVLIGPGRPQGLPLPLPLPPSNLAKPMPLNVAPTKPISFNIPETDVSHLLGLIKSNNQNREVEMIIPLRTFANSKVDSSRVSNYDEAVMIEKPLSKITTTSTDVSDQMQSSTTKIISVSKQHNIIPSESLSPPLSSVTWTSSSSSSLSPSSYEIFSSMRPFEHELPSIESAISTPISLSMSKVSITSRLITGLESGFHSEKVESEDSKIATKVNESPHLVKEENVLPSGPVTAWVPVFLPPGMRTNEYNTDEDPIIITMPEEPSVYELTVKQHLGAQNSDTDKTMPKIEPTPVVIMESPRKTATSETLISTIESSISSSISIHEFSRDNQSSDLNKVSSNNSNSTNVNVTEPEIVYGRPASLNVQKPISPSFTTNIEDVITLSAMGSMNTKVNNNLAPKNKLTPVGKPTVVAVEMDEVRPQVGGGGVRKKPPINPSVITEPGQGSVYIDGRPTYYNVNKNVGSVPTIQVGLGVNVAGGEDGDKQGILSPQVSPTKPLLVRRPPFRPRPSVPIVRIDTCIVGDDSTCEMALNEKCQTELGISSCQCRPGFARTVPRTNCIPIVSLAFSMKVDRLGEKKLHFNRNYLNSNSEDYQYLEYESLQAINSAFALSNLARVFLGVKINRFYSVAGKTIVNATINLELSNATTTSSIKRLVQQELSRVIAIRNNNIGESQLWVEGSLNAIPRVEDVNECSSVDLNDCSKQYGKCINEFGTFKCKCQAGYEDKFPHDKLKSGRVCSACSPLYCSNRGECLIINGQRECKCKGSFIGSKCDIDAEVLGVALGGSLAALIIIIITFLCLYMWNQRWKRDQQKMEAMSAASGHTFSYVNKQAATAYRLTMDDRMRWAQIAEAMSTNPGYASNYYVNPDHLTTASHQQSSHQPLQHHQHHVYATPSRVQTPDALLNDDTFESRQYSRSMRPKSRSGYSMKNGVPPESVYNETEFSTREMIYSPAHLISPRSQFSYS